MRHQKAKQWEQKLKHVFDQIDVQLETQYAGRFRRHPARPKKGTTANPEMDGLFNVGASYSAGFGSKFGPGYVVDIRVATLQTISRHFKNELRDTVQHLLKQKLPTAFPNKKLSVCKEKNYLRIHGDLSLD
jgi:hypothetical protein